MDPALIQFLLENGGPVLRWRTATELAGEDGSIDREALQADLLACPEVIRWLDLLGRGPVHHSMDASAENVLAKLCEYGLRAGMPGMDERILPFCALGEGERYHAEALVLAPFLVRAGYAGEPRVVRWIAERIDRLYEQACQGEYDLYMDEAERHCLPPSQRLLHGAPKLFYRQRYQQHWNVLSLPTCYDLYALAYLPDPGAQTRQKVETIEAYLLHPAFQQTPGGYIWNGQRRQAYAAGRVFLACLPGKAEPEKMILFLEMLARFEVGQASEWFRQGMDHLEGFHTDTGTYCFPRAYLSESSGYYLYAGSHMGLGETPRNRRALELESTFRMVRLRRTCVL